MTQEEIKKRIEMYGVIINDPSEDQGTKDLAKSKVVKLQSQLDDEVVVEETEEEIYGDGDAEFQEEVNEIEVKPKPKKKTPKAKAKGRGRPKKRGRPAKRKKAPTSKQKATKLSKAIGLSEEECRELLEKYDSEDKARKKRLSKRKKAGKSPDLTVTESLEKEAKVVKHKVADKKTPTSKTQAKAQGSRITALVKAILEGIDGKTDKVKQIDAIISQLEAEKKRIQSQKGVGGFLFGSAVGGYTGYKIGTLQEQRKVEDLFKGEKKLAKDFKNAMKEQKKKKKEEEKFEYAEFEEMKKGGKTQGYDDTQDESLGMRTGKESSKKQSMKARREDSYGKWGKRDQEGRHISMAKGGDTDKGLTGAQRDRMADDIYMSEQTMSDSMFQAIDDEVEGDWDVGLYRLSDSQLKKMHTDIKEDRASSYTEHKKGGKTQGYDDKQDESLGMRTGKESSKKQSMKARREDSYGKWGKRGMRKGRR